MRATVSISWDIDPLHVEEDLDRMVSALRWRSLCLTELPSGGEIVGAVAGNSSERHLRWNDDSLGWQQAALWVSEG